MPAASDPPATASSFSSKPERRREILFYEPYFTINRHNLCSFQAFGRFPEGGEPEKPTPNQPQNDPQSPPKPIRNASNPTRNRSCRDRASSLQSPRCQRAPRRSSWPRESRRIRTPALNSPDALRHGPTNAQRAKAESSRRRAVRSRLPSRVRSIEIKDSRPL
jgi:hypothetical protein